MKKALLATAVSAVFAAPTTVLAQAAAAVPTLDKVLEASGITVNGYIDAAYQHADRNLECSGCGFRVFDNQNNSFVLHQVGLTVAKQPKEGAGGLVNLTAGKDAAVIHSFDTQSESQFDVTQAYAQYATGPITVIAGKYVTMHGTEVIASTGNTNFSRSILFGSVPFTHTGLRATYAMSDAVSLMVGLNNGWDQVKDSNKGKTVELGLTLTPIKPLSIVASFMRGKENVPLFTGATEGQRTSANLVGTYTLSDTISFGAEYLRVQQDHATSLTDGSTIKAKYDGIAGYFTYMIAPKLRAALRAESFKDTDGFRFGVAPGTKYKEFTATLGYLQSANFELRGEIRRDTASNDVFTDTGSGAMKKNLMTYAVQALYKF
jgi:putative OmpL-like beta-barrel porin-2